MADRVLLERRLEPFEALVERLNAGEPVPTRVLAECIDAVREGTGDDSDANRYIPPTRATSLHLREMCWALEAMERGESGAAGHFVRNAREYGRLLREQSRDTA
jgi:hypothetical protein